MAFSDKENTRRIITSTYDALMKAHLLAGPPIIYAVKLRGKRARYDIKDVLHKSDFPKISEVMFEFGAGRNLSSLTLQNDGEYRTDNFRQSDQEILDKLIPKLDLGFHQTPKVTPKKPSMQEPKKTQSGLNMARFVMKKVEGRVFDFEKIAREFKELYPEIGPKDVADLYSIYAYVIEDLS